MGKAHSYVRKRLPKVMALTLLTGILGMAAILPPVGEKLEERGLELLFLLRGPRKPPPEVVTIAIDDFSADALHIRKVRNLPRDLHARLVEGLARNGAKLIVLDLFLQEEQSREGDRRFAAAMKKAGNVVLSQSIEARAIQVDGSDTVPIQYAELEQIFSPLPLFAESAAGLAPFPVARTLSKAIKWWTFKEEAGECPTMPVIAFHLFNPESLAYLASKIPDDSRPVQDQVTETATRAHRVDQLIRRLRDAFRNNPGLSRDIILGREYGQIGEDALTHRLQSLINLYLGPDTVYLNFYGPPGTIPSFSYLRVLQALEDPQGKGAFDFKGKAVFVGCINLKSLDQNDSFQTVFSKPTRTDISGIEVAATAFANLLEDASVLPLRSERLVEIVWGCAILFALISVPLSALSSAISMAAVGGIYLWIAKGWFASQAVWLPLVVPWSIQAPTAFLGGVLWNYYELRKDRQKLRKAFGLYIPDSVVDQVVRDLTARKTSSQVLFGSVMLSDGEQYTSLSESLPPLELSRFMNSYYEALFEPVRSHGGVVSDIVGDSMVALWTMVEPNPEPRLRSCLAALDAMKEVAEFNRRSSPLGLKTRIGLHYGRILIGTIGGKGHYEYRPVGDVVNTASRIEGLNKWLGTRVLVSGDVLSDIELFLARRVGDFVLAGKSKPISVYELMANREEATKQQMVLARVFEEGLDAFKEQKLADALRAFESCLKITEDGPADFYIGHCRKSLQNPSDSQWDGIIHQEKK